MSWGEKHATAERLSLRWYLDYGLFEPLPGHSILLTRLVGRMERNGVPGPVLNQLGKRRPERKHRGPQDVLDALRRGR